MGRTKEKQENREELEVKIAQIQTQISIYQETRRKEKENNRKKKISKRGERKVNKRRTLKEKSYKSV